MRQFRMEKSDHSQSYLDFVNPGQDQQIIGCDCRETTRLDLENRLNDGLVLI